ncbi:hypothetical protein R9X47_10310 [Wukongibacter baidiensis]|uniref:hypothetical protein n=1 Tax=Wukongibacter baidiensis TaxID=1723361 RepID=UPI003D7F1A82
MMNKTYKYIYTLLCYCITGFGISLTIRANIGVSCFNSLNLAISNASGIKIGTITIILNLIFLLGYMLLTSFSTPIKYSLQIISTILLGFFINASIYYVTPYLHLDSYLSKLLTFIIGTTIAGLSTGMIINLNIITFPLESLCHALSGMLKYSFLKLRYSFDIIFIVLSITLSYFFKIQFFVREGTIISLILLSASINLAKSIYLKYKLTSKE